MPRCQNQVRPKLPFLPPAYNPTVVRLVHWALPVLLRARLQPWLPAGIAGVETENAETLAELFQKFQQGRIRFAIAFRHVEVDDPLPGLYLLSRAIPRVARQQSIALKTPLHAHFVYERGMTLWAGSWLGPLFSRMGGIPIRRGRQPDWAGLRAARHLFANGELPLAIAPEGATNGQSDRIGPLEPGAAQLGFWCAADLKRAGRSESVYLLPVGIRYRYLEPSWPALDRLFAQLERDCGLAAWQADPSGDRGGDYRQRMLRLGDRLLEAMAGFYGRLTHQKLPIVAPTDAGPEAELAARLQVLLEVALQASERYFGLPSTGNLPQRCRRLEEAGWTDIYREDLPPRQTLSPLDRGLADWLAMSASLYQLHMRLVEGLVAVTADSVREPLTFERLAELALIFFDLLSRIKGERVSRRPRLGWRAATLTIADPISIAERWPIYKTDRRGAVAILTADLQEAFTNNNRIGGNKC